MKLLILRLLVAADLASACQVNKDLFSLEADDQDCLWRRHFLAVHTNYPVAKRWLCGGGTASGGVPDVLEGDFTWTPPSSGGVRLAVSNCGGAAPRRVVRSRVC